MIELILIIIILGIFVTMAMTRTRSGLGTIREQIAIDQITSDIDLVKAMAFGKHDTITIVFSTSQESYTIFLMPFEMPSRAHPLQGNVKNRKPLSINSLGSSPGGT